MAENLKTLLERLENELTGKIATLRRELAPLERELADVRLARQAVTRRESQDKTKRYPYKIAVRETTLRRMKDVAIEYQNKTMKQLALEALKEHFRNGATANELLEFFANAWGRSDIARESFSPQLSRLKVEGKVHYDGKRWHLIHADQGEASSEDRTEIETPANESAGASGTVGDEIPSQEVSGNGQPQAPGRDPG